MTSRSPGLGYYGVGQCRFQCSGPLGSWLPFTFASPALSVGNYLEVLVSCFSVGSASDPQGLALLLLLSFMRTVSYTCAVGVANSLAIFLYLFSRFLPKTNRQGRLAAPWTALLFPPSLLWGPALGRDRKCQDLAFLAIYSDWGDHVILFWLMTDKGSFLGGV